MAVERNAFIPPVQEKKRVFEDRLQIFPQGFFVLADTGEETVKKHGSALVAGYFCSELWAADSIDPAASEKETAKRFSLGHKIYKSHRRDGRLLYVSSYALLQQYRGCRLGLPFFRAALAALCGAFSQIQTVVLLVNEEWEGARHIYEKLGFTPLRTLEGFFPSLHKKAADGIIMTAAADSFRAARLVTNGNGAVIVEGGQGAEA